MKSVPFDDLAEQEFYGTHTILLSKNDALAKALYREITSKGTNIISNESAVGAIKQLIVSLGWKDVFSTEYLNDCKLED